MGVVITVDVVVGVLVHGARSRRRRTSQEENGREWHRHCGRVTGPPGAARGPTGRAGMDRDTRWASPAKLHCNLVRITLMGFMDSNFYPDATQEIPHLQHDSPHIEAEQPSAR